MSRRIAVVGTINHDRIVHADGSSHEDLGGILYNVLTLAPFIGEGDSIIPVARVGVERREEIEDLLAPYPCVDLSSLLWWAGGTNETVLRYRSADERDETLIERIDPLGEEDVRPAAVSDYVLANLIWGKELSPPLLRFLTERGARLVLDIQSLPLTFAGAPERAYRNIPEWREWAAAASVVKGNEQEIRWFVGEDGPYPGSLRDAMKILLHAGPRVVLATRGASGASIAWRGERGDRIADIPAVPVPAEECLDSTGCGDAFTSGFLLGLLRGEGPLHAALLGSALAASVCRTRGLRALRGLPEPAVVRGRVYGSMIDNVCKDNILE